MSTPQGIAVPDTEAAVADDTQQKLQQLTPHDLWIWNAQYHWKHWHGLWTMWAPSNSAIPLKQYKSVRSLWPVDPQRKHLYHRNQWYETSGEGPDIDWEKGPWALYEHKHSLPDGILHPNSSHHRILQFPNGDLGWVQLRLDPENPKSVIFDEFHFMASENARVAVVVGYNQERKMIVAMILEEERENDERPEAGWKGSIWKHHRAALDEQRKEPAGTFVGTEMSITAGLMMLSRKAVWKGFRGGLNEEESQCYTTVHLPYGFTVFAPKDADAAIGRAHAYYISWLQNENTVRLMSAIYSAEGNLEAVKSGTYQKSA